MTLNYSFIEDFKNKEPPKIKDVLHFDVLETLCPATIDKSGKMTYKNQLLGLIKINNNLYSSFNWEVYPEDGTQALVFRGRVTDTNVEYITFPIYNESTNYFVMIKPLVANEVPIKAPSNLMPVELNAYSDCGRIQSRIPTKVTPSRNLQLRNDVPNPSVYRAGEPLPPFKEEIIENYKSDNMISQNSVDTTPTSTPTPQNPLTYTLDRMGMVDTSQSTRSTFPNLNQIFKIFYTSQIIHKKNATTLEGTEILISNPIKMSPSTPSEHWTDADISKYEKMFDLHKLPTSITLKSENSDSSSLSVTDEEDNDST